MRTDCIRSKLEERARRRIEKSRCLRGRWHQRTVRVFSRKCVNPGLDYGGSEKLSRTDNDVLHQKDAATLLPPA